MAGESQLSVFLTANIASFQDQLQKALAEFKGTVAGMKASGDDLSAALASTTVEAAAQFAQLNPAIQESAANYLRVREALQGVSSALKETESIIADAGGINGVNNDIIAQWSAETTSQILLQKELTTAMSSYKAALSETLAAQQADIKLKQDAAVATRNAALASAEAAASEYAANTGAAASEAEATAEDNARAAALARLIGLKETDAAASRTEGTAQVQATTEASAGYTRLAEARIANARAQAELSAAQSNAVDLIGMEASTTGELALALERAAVASAELAEAQAALKTEVAGTNSVMDIFRQRMIVGENGIRAFVTTSLTSLPLLAGIFATTFAVHAANAMKDTELELGNLSRATGIGVQSLTELGQSAEQMGAKSAELDSMMRRLDSTISMAASGGATQVQILKELGVETDNWHGTIPPTLQVLAQMADFLKLNAGNAETMRAGMRALGTDSPALLAWLSQGSDGIAKQGAAYAELGRKEQEELKNARDLQAEEQKVGAEWDKVKLAMIPVVDWTIKITGATLEFLGHAQPLERLIEDIAQAWSFVTRNTEEATKANNEYMRGVLSGAVAAPKGIFGAGGLEVPKPPDIATPKPTKDKKAPFQSEMSEFREELAQREAAFEGSRLDMLEMERDFWSRILDVNRAHGKDVIAVQTEIARATVAIHKEEAAEEAKTEAEIDAEKKRSREEAKRELAELEKAEKARNTEAVREAKAIADEEIRGIQERLRGEEATYSLQKKNIADLSSKDLESKRATIDGLAQVTAAEETAQLKALQAELAVLTTAQQTVAGLKGEEAAFIAFGKQIEEVYRKIGLLGTQTAITNASTQIAQINRVAAAYTSVFTTIESSMKKTLDGVLLGTQTFGRAMAQVWNNIVLSVVNDMAKMLLEHIRNSIAMVIVTQQTQAQQVAAVAAGETAKTAAKQAGSSSNLALELAQSLKSIAIAAGQSAAHAYKWVMTEVPFPANVALAPAAAAAAFAATIAFGGKAGSAAMGAMLGEDTLVQAHAGEMIVPAHITSQLNRALSLPRSMATGLSSMASSAGGGTRNQRFNIENHFHNAGDVNEKVVTDMIRRAIKRGSA